MKIKFIAIIICIVFFNNTSNFAQGNNSTSSLFDFTQPLSPAVKAQIKKLIPDVIKIDFDEEIVKTYENNLGIALNPYEKTLITHLHYLLVKFSLNLNKNAVEKNVQMKFSVIRGKTNTRINSLDEVNNIIDRIALTLPYSIKIQSKKDTVVSKIIE